MIVCRTPKPRRQRAQPSFVRLTTPCGQRYFPSQITHTPLGFLCGQYRAHTSSFACDRHGVQARDVGVLNRLVGNNNLQILQIRSIVKIMLYYLITFMAIGLGVNQKVKIGWKLIRKSRLGGRLCYGCYGFGGEKAL